MINILCIGQYDAGGKFFTTQWEHYVEWCKTECNKIIIYTRMSYDNVCNKFSLYCIVNELEKPDETLDVCAYEMDVINTAFWNYFKADNYDIDIRNSVSHIYFFHGTRNIASLEITDYENYVLIEEPITQEKMLMAHKEMILKNIHLCEKGGEDIEQLVEGEFWRPLGYR